MDVALWSLFTEMEAEETPVHREDVAECTKSQFDLNFTNFQGVLYSDPRSLGSVPNSQERMERDKGAYKGMRKGRKWTEGERRRDKKLSYCWETVRRESMPRIAEMDVEMTT